MFLIKNDFIRALASVAQLIGHRPANQKVAGLIPSQAWDVDSVPSQGL